MKESQSADQATEILLLAHLRRVAIGEILQSLDPADAHRVVSAACQRLAQYRDEGPTPSTAQAATEEQFRAAIDRIIEELREPL